MKKTFQILHYKPAAKHYGSDSFPRIRIETNLLVQPRINNKKYRHHSILLKQTTTNKSLSFHGHQLVEDKNPQGSECFVIELFILFFSTNRSSSNFF